MKTRTFALTPVELREIAREQEAEDFACYPYAEYVGDAFDGPADLPVGDPLELDDLTWEEPVFPQDEPEPAWVARLADLPF